MSTPRKLPGPISSGVSLKDLRVAVTDLSSKGTDDVDAIRRSFVAGIPPLQTVSSGSSADFISRFGGEGMKGNLTKSTSRFGLNTSVVGTFVTPPKPELDFVEVLSDQFVGTLDSFHTRVVISLPLEDVPRVAGIRILRAYNGTVPGLSKPSFSAMTEMMGVAGKTKSVERISNVASRVNSVGIGNKLTDFVTDDSFSNQRAVISSGTLRPVMATANTNRRGTSAGLISLDNVDRSVLENVTFFVNQRTSSPAKSLDQSLVVGQRSGINVLQGSIMDGRSPLVEMRNSSGFFEISRITAANGVSVGGFLEIEYIDPSVVYGASYTYYVSAVDNDGLEGPRSRIVKVDVMTTTPPGIPTVLYGVVAGRPRFSIRCSGSFIDHVEVFRKGGVIPESVRVLNTRRSMIDDMTPVMINSGFYHIGDLGVGADRSTIFVDRNVTNGDALDYRFYTVDSFGAKSQTPFSCSVVLPNHGESIPLPMPSITAEQDSGGRSVVISVSCDDLRISSFVIGRRDVSLNETSYRQPSQADYFYLGTPSAKRSRSRKGPSLNKSSAKAWDGVFAAMSGGAKFTDLAVEFDRTYQYAVFAVDRRGNKTSTVPAPPVFVSVKPVSDPPLAISGSVIIDSGGNTPLGVRIDWSGGTSDFSPNELIGDQDVLTATNRRSVYQVERREVGRSSWDALPATTGTHFIDIVSLNETPKFRPPYAIPNGQYDYRVIAMQSGAFVSTHTDVVRVLAAPPIVTPGVLWIKSTPSSIRPLNLVVSWQYDGQFVDGWEVSRAATNKIFGSKIFSMNSADARALPYSVIAKVTRESSQARGISVTGDLDPKIFVGNRFFIDKDIDLANSYFYRVRAVDSRGGTSGWVYGGMSMTDSPHDRKFFTSLSDKEKSSMTLDMRPIKKWRNG